MIFNTSLVCLLLLRIHYLSKSELRGRAGSEEDRSAAEPENLGSCWLDFPDSPSARYHELYF